jgi:hypothetical protein
MSKAEHQLDDLLRDVFIACGEVVLNELRTRPFRTTYGGECLLKKILRDVKGPLWRLQPYLPANLLEDVEDYSCVPEGDLAMEVLRKFHSLGGPPFWSGALDNTHPAATVMLAALGADCLRTDNSPGLAILPLLKHLEPFPSGWKGILQSLWSLALEPSSLFELAPAAGACSGFDLTATLTRRGYGALGIPPPAQEPIMPERDTRSRPRGLPREPRKSDRGDDISCINLIDTLGFALNSVVLPESAHADLSFVAAVLRDDPLDVPVVLFHGPPGTGKTHAAKALAGEVGRPLAAVSVCRILDPYVGNSEKAIRRAFEEAREAGAILLVDEADGLLGDRAFARHSWERTTVNTLLACLDDARVPCILNTNLFRVIDPAVHRRVRVILEFPLPEFAGRREIWALELLKEGLDGDLDLDALAQVVLSGGLIHSAVLAASARRKHLTGQFQVSTRALLQIAQKESQKVSGKHRTTEIGFRVVSPNTAGRDEAWRAEGGGTGMGPEEVSSGSPSRDWGKPDPPPSPVPVSRSRG